MRIVVTGGAGLVGSHTAEYFAERGHEVVVYDALIRSYLAGVSAKSVEHNWSRLQANPRIRCVKGDVRSWEMVQQVFDPQVGAVIHAAGQPGVGFSMQHPLEDFHINALGTLHVLEAVRQRCPKAKIVFCSTNKVYGANVDHLAIASQPTRYAFAGGAVGVSETLSTDLTSHTAYGASKLAADVYVQDYAHIYGLRTAVFRMSCIYGEHQFGFEEQGWLAHFTICTILGRPMTIYGDGKQVRDVLYVQDIVQAFDRWIFGEYPSGVFNIGGGADRTLSLLELLELLKRETGAQPAVGYQGWRPKDQKVYISDLRHIQRALGWSPTVSVEEGVRKLIGWVQANRGLFA